MPEFALKDGEFWLPPQFLTDDEVIPSMTAVPGSKKLCTIPLGGQRELTKQDFLLASSEFESLGFSPDLILPAESVLESDENDYPAVLTRQMAHSTLDDSPRKNPYYGFTSDNTEAWVTSGSPQSTLCDGAMGCGCKMQCSSLGSPDGLSPPIAPAPATCTTWDLLSAAAAEVSKMPYSEFGYYSRARLSHQRQVNMQILKMKQEYVRKQLSQVAWGSSQLKGGTGMGREMGVPTGVGTGYVLNRNSRPVGVSWPTLQRQPLQQQQNGSAMRAVFLGSYTAKKECAGTGVFLPRRAGYPADPRKKSGCSTVLVPARVAQALNLKLEDMGGAQSQFQSRNSGNFCSDGGRTLKLRNTSISTPAAQKYHNVRPQPAVSHEIGLPQEWTY